MTAHVQSIRREIMAWDRHLRDKYPLLKRQDLLGALILLGVVVWITLTALAYIGGHLPAFMAVILMALAMSIAHELEHDLIHDLYFSKRPAVYNGAMYLIWFLKLHANPFWPKKLHLRHHSYSGQKEDWEERLLGMGQPLGWRRLAVTLLPFGQVLYFDSIRRRDPKFDPQEAKRANLPLGVPFYVLAAAAILNLLLPSQLHDLLPSAFWQVISTVTVLWVLPSMLRYSCLTLITTASHYADDIPANSVFFENQILDHWLLWPLQCFCFNFGATHIVHHYMVPQPFYLRQMVATRVRKTLISAGCRHNDLAVIRRANRWNLEESWVGQVP